MLLLWIRCLVTVSGMKMDWDEGSGMMHQLFLKLALSVYVLMLRIPSRNFEPHSEKSLLDPQRLLGEIEIFEQSLKKRNDGITE